MKKLFILLCLLLISLQSVYAVTINASDVYYPHPLFVTANASDVQNNPNFSISQMDIQVIEQDLGGNEVLNSGNSIMTYNSQTGLYEFTFTFENGYSPSSTYFVEVVAAGTNLTTNEPWEIYGGRDYFTIQDTPLPNMTHHLIQNHTQEILGINDKLILSFNSMFPITEFEIQYLLNGNRVDGTYEVQYINGEYHNVLTSSPNIKKIYTNNDKDLDVEFTIPKGTSHGDLTYQFYGDNGALIYEGAFPAASFTTNMTVDYNLYPIYINQSTITSTNTNPLKVYQQDNITLNLITNRKVSYESLTMFIDGVQTSMPITTINATNSTNATIVISPQNEIRGSFTFELNVSYKNNASSKIVYYNITHSDFFNQISIDTVTYPALLNFTTYTSNTNSSLAHLGDTIYFNITANLPIQSPIFNTYNHLAYPVFQNINTTYSNTNTSLLVSYIVHNTSLYEYYFFKLAFDVIGVDTYNYELQRINFSNKVFIDTTNRLKVTNISIASSNANNSLANLNDKITIGVQATQPLNNIQLLNASLGLLPINISYYDANKSANITYVVANSNAYEIFNFTLHLNSPTYGAWQLNYTQDSLSNKIVIDTVTSNITSKKSYTNNINYSLAGMTNLLYVRVKETNPISNPHISFLISNTPTNTSNIIYKLFENNTLLRVSYPISAQDASGVVNFTLTYKIYGKTITLTYANFSNTLFVNSSVNYNYPTHCYNPITNTTNMTCVNEILDANISLGTYPLINTTHVIQSPASVHPFYTKYLNAYTTNASQGIIILTTDDLPDAALYSARDTVNNVLAYNNSYRINLSSQNAKLFLVSQYSIDLQNNLSINPKHNNMGLLPQLTDGIEGGGAETGGEPITYTEQSGICYTNNPHEQRNAVLEEFTHTVQNIAYPDAMNQMIAQALMDSVKSLEEGGFGINLSLLADSPQEGQNIINLFKANNYTLNSNYDYKSDYLDDEYYVAGVYSWVNNPFYFFNATNQTDLHAKDLTLYNIVAQNFATNVSWAKSCQSLPPV